MKINKYIEIVGSSNARLNAMSKQSRLQVLTALQKRYANVQITIIDDMQDLAELVAKKPDLIVLGMKLLLLEPELGYDDSAKVWLSDYLAEHGINFSGSETVSLQLQFDKPVTKQHVLDAGLQSSPYFISTLDEPTFAHGLTFPLFVKPTNRGGSKGIDKQSVVHTQEALEAKISSVHDEYRADVLIEEYLSGREFSVAVAEDIATGRPVAMPIEIVSPADDNGNSFLSAAVKKADLEKVAAVADSALKTAINDLAISVFESLGSRDYGRIDIRLDAHGIPNFIEANLMPGLSNHGYLSRCFALNKQLDYDDMIFSIAELGLKRSMRFTPLDVVNSARSFTRGGAPELVTIPT